VVAIVKKPVATAGSSPRWWSRHTIRALIIVVVGSGVGVLWRPEALNARADAPGATPEFLRYIPPDVALDEVRRAFESGELVVVDARKRARFEAGHIPGALALYDDPVMPAFRALRRWIPLDRPCIVVCRDSKDTSSSRVASRLRFLGLRQARTLRGGMAAWVAAGLPVAKGWDMAPIIEGHER